jgi:hypothetical protein
VDTIEPGVDFTEAIVVAVESCAVLLAVIGPQWLIAADEQGRRRLEDPDDIVRLEIEAALSRGVRVIPILVEDAAMPRRQDLPAPLGALARRNAFTIRHESFRYDAERLISAVEGALEAAAREGVAPEGGQAGKGAQPASGSRPAAAQERWLLDLVRENSSKTNMTFRLRSGDRSHLVNLEFPFFKGDVIRWVPAD